MNNASGNASQQHVTPSFKMDSRPGLLTALLITFIIVGGAGILTTLFTSQYYFKSRTEAMDDADPTKSFMGKLQGGANLPDKFVQVQREMSGDMYDKLLPLRTFRWVQAGLNTILSTALIVFSILAFRRKALGKKGLLLVSALHIPYELLWFAVMYQTAQITTGAMEQWMGKLQAAQGAASSANMPKIGTITNAIMVVQYSALALGFIALFILAIIYLRRQAASQWCSE
ncbi:MAG: hypothetical protein JXR76_21680 [Deltaproteobacteria bacterium]|nr:hypothetical protein [Deltaproteobacteria bacterium]